MVIGKKGENVRADMEFPYNLKPLYCRIQDSKKQAIKEKMIYVKCNRCDGLIEMWTDEKIGYCLDCGRTLQISSPVLV
jgi:hypothetical protein